MKSSRGIVTLALMMALAAGALAACRPSSPYASYQLETRADSLAMEVYDALGGPEAWASLRYLEFNFGVERDRVASVAARHLWDRHQGNYRVEWTTPADTTLVVLFNVNTQQGQAYANGNPVEPERSAALVQQGYRRFINDSYWMLAPIKMLDEGVSRQYVADSSDADTDVLLLSFEGVGLTPGDRYWIYIDGTSRRVDRWAYVLQGNPDAAPSYFRWTDYQTLDAPRGQVRIATRKEALDGSRAILTDGLDAPSAVEPDMFTDPMPRL